MKQPNILVFMTDQQRYDVTTGETACRMPNVARIANEGIRFTHVYPTMSHCCPSRASFMTGRYPSEHGIFNNVCNNAAFNKGIHKGVRMWSEHLRDAGYTMRYCGKWHVSAEENPSDRGWDEGYIFADKNARMGFPLREWEGRKDSPATPREEGVVKRKGWGDVRLYGERNEVGRYLWDTPVIDSAKEHLDTLISNNDDAPWCLYVGTGAPHDPFILPKEYATMYNADDVTLPQNYEDRMTDKPDHYRRLRARWSQLPEDEVRAAIAHYYGGCTMTDDMFGELIAMLEERDELDNTLIVFTSDHGEALGAHGLFYKGLFPFEESYRVPLIMRFGENIAHPGRACDALVSLMDIAPTLTDVTGADAIPDVKGMSLLPFLRNKKTPAWRDSLYMQNNGLSIYYTQRIVRDARYKFVYNAVSFDELYDLEEDPFEMTNLADAPAYREVKRAMYKKMWQHALALEDDFLSTGYSTVATAGYGPMIAFDNNYNT